MRGGGLAGEMYLKSVCHALNLGAGSTKKEWNRTTNLNLYYQVMTTVFVAVVLEPNYIFLSVFHNGF